MTENVTTRQETDSGIEEFGLRSAFSYRVDGKAWEFGANPELVKPSAHRKKSSSAGTAVRHRVSGTNRRLRSA